jgi:hypothetical protein
MKKSNIITGFIVITLMAVVAVCLMAFRQTEEWRKRTKEIQLMVEGDRKLSKAMLQFADSCKQVEELIIESKDWYNGSSIYLADTSMRLKSLTGTERMEADTIFENGGKKLIIRIKEKEYEAAPYYDLILLLPQVKSIYCTNGDVVLFCSPTAPISATLKGESSFRFTKPVYAYPVNITLTDVSLANCTALQTMYNISIKASGNAIVGLAGTPEDIEKNKRQVVLSENAIIEVKK